MSFHDYCSHFRYFIRKYAQTRRVTVSTASVSDFEYKSQLYLDTSVVYPVQYVNIEDVPAFYHLNREVQ